MAKATDVTELATALEGTTQHPHFDRTAFKVVRIYATLAADARSLNLKLAPDEQEWKVLSAPHAFSAVPGKWGEQGWTTLWLGKVTKPELADTLRLAWQHGRAKRPRR